MPSASIEFPLLQKITPLGPVSDPKIPVGVRTTAGYRTFQFVIDTGADFSLAPKRLASQIGLDWQTLPETRMVGIANAGVSARLGRLPIRIDHVEIVVRCLFIEGQRGLLLLGRADFLDHFVLTIDQPKHRIVLSRTV